MTDYPQWKDTPGAKSPALATGAMLFTALIIALAAIGPPRGCYWNGTHFGRVPGLGAGEYVKQTVWHDDGSATVTIDGPDGERSFRERPVNGIYYTFRGHPSEPDHVDDFNPPVIIFLP